MSGLDKLVDDALGVGPDRSRYHAALARMAVWCDQLVDAERRLDASPDLNGYLHTETPVMLFREINAELDAAESEGGDTLAGRPVRLAGVMTIAQYQQRLAELLAAAPAADTGFFVASINNSNEGLEYTQELLLRVECDDVALAALQHADSGFVMLAKQAASRLTGVIFADVDVCFADLFGAAWLHSGLDAAAFSPAEATAESRRAVSDACASALYTLMDYYDELEPMLNPVWFERLVREHLTRLVSAYEDALFSPRTLAAEGAAAHWHLLGPPVLTADISNMALFFQKYIRKRKVDEELQALADVRELLEPSPADEVARYFHPLVFSMRGVVNFAHVEHLFALKTDLDVDARERIRRHCCQLVVNGPVGECVRPPAHAALRERRRRELARAARSAAHAASVRVRASLTDRGGFAHEFDVDDDDHVLAAVAAGQPSASPQAAALVRAASVVAREAAHVASDESSSALTDGSPGCCDSSDL